MRAAQIAEQLRGAIAEGEQLFGGFDDASASVAPRQGAWCAKEIVGHLIDSACNNHRRFVIGQSAASYVFEGYAQNDWVSRQRYRDVPWRDLVELWRAYNRHLAHVIASAPDAIIAERKMPHNYDEILSEQISRDEPQSLAALMEDYVVHLRHHLAQVRGLGAREPG